MSQINKIINKILGFSNFDGWMNLNRIHIENLKSPIDFKSFLNIAHGHVLYGKTTRGDPGRAQKPVKKSYKKICNLFRVGGAHLLGARDIER